MRAAAALAAREDPDEFFRRYREFQAAAAVAGIEVVPGSPAGEQPPTARAFRGLQASAIGVIAENVTFVVGLDHATGSRAGVTTVSVNTNLLGAAAGSAISALGASGLVDYFKNNVSAGVAVPLARASTLAARLGRRQLVPVVSVGVRLPYYHPGDATAALGALFTSRRTDFVRAGRGALTFGVAVPLYRVRPAPKV